MRLCFVAIIGFLGITLSTASAQDIYLDARLISLSKEIAGVRHQQVQLQTEFQNERQDRQRLQGEIEKLGFVLRNLKTRLDKLVGDLDLRLQEIEDALSKTTPTGESSSPASGETPTSALQEAPENSLGQVRLDAEGNVIGATLAPQQSYAARYDNALKQIQQNSYAEARTTLSALYQENPKHVLTGNVLYWLGETYYVEGAYDRAMSQFARSALNFPDGAKSLDSLLKIGLSLGQLGRLEEACKTLNTMGDKAKSLSQTLELKRFSALKNLDCIT